MNKFANLTNLEVYVLKRAMIESASVFHFLDVYNDDEEFKLCAQRLLNELCDEDGKRFTLNNNILLNEVSK